MEKTLIITKLKEIIAPFLEHEDDEVLEQVNENTNLVDELAFDSVDLIEIVIEMEQEFNIKIADNEIHNIKTVKDIVDLIQAKVES